MSDNSDETQSEQIVEAVLAEDSQDIAAAHSDTKPTSNALVPLEDDPPAILPAIILDDMVPYPGPIVPLMLDTKVRRDAVLHAKSNNGFFILLNRLAGANEQSEQTVENLQQAQELAQQLANLEQFQEIEITVEKLPEDVPAAVEPLSLEDLATVGVMTRVLRIFQMPDKKLTALIQLMRRAQPIDLIKNKPFPIVRVIYPLEIVSDQKTFDATYGQVRNTLSRFLNDHPNISDEIKMAAMGIDNPSLLADFVAQHLSRDFAERIRFLVELDLAERIKMALEVVIRELDLLTVGNRISEEIREKIEKHQREFFLREQMKSIRTELGEEKDPATVTVDELRAKLVEAGPPDNVMERAEHELGRLQLIPTESPEHNVIRTYVEWIANLPWSKTTEDSKDLAQARIILDKQHYGLKDIKERIVEFLAVRILNPDHKGSLLCFAGPPGVGKTSLGKSIAEALGREFYRFSVGGMRDESEIKGHRRTYVGAMPGRLLHAMKQVGVANPVIMLDEIDKMGSDWRGDPSSAMLEVLDPAQNSGFLDHYLDLPFDLSRVMFIATANVKSNIPGPLLDRLEVIDLPGYIPDEKVEIGVRHLLPRQRQRHGLARKHLNLGKTTMRRLVREYTHEAGVRELDRQIGKLCRKRATAIVAGDDYVAAVKGDDVIKMLGPPKIHDERITRFRVPGVALGLAWTPVGGEVLLSKQWLWLARDN